MKITIHQRQIEALFHRAAQAAETARDTASEAAGLAGRRPRRSGGGWSGPRRT